MSSKNRREGKEEGAKRPNYRIARKFPGWRSGWFEMSTGQKSMTEAIRLEDPVLAAYRHGYLDILDALKDGELTLLELRREFDLGGLAGAREYVADRRQKAQASQHTIGKLLEQFQADPPSRRDKQRLRDRTLKDYVAHIASFDTWLTEALRRPATVRDIAETNLNAYRKHLTKPRARSKSQSKSKPTPVQEGRRSATANRRINSLGKFCTWLVEQGLLAANPVRKVRLSTKAENTERDESYRYLETEQVRALLRAAQDEDREHPPAGFGPHPCAMWLEVLLATGATTYTEGGSISLKSIRFGYVRHGMVELYLHGTKSQYRKRHVWIPTLLASRLKKYATAHGLKRDQPLFPWDRYVGREYWQRVIDRVVAAGFPELAGKVTYDLRHTFAVHAVRGDPDNGKPGVDLMTLMELMGHNRLQTTQIYARHRAHDAPRALAVSSAVLGLLSGSQM